MSYPTEFIKFCDDILVEGCEKFQMSMGIVSHIVHDIYEVVSIYPKSDSVQSGTTFELQDTYCREVVLTNSIVDITSYDGLPGKQNHPLYKSIPIEAYISAPIRYNNEIWGTLNFTNIAIRREPFTASDKLWLEMRTVNICHQLVALNY